MLHLASKVLKATVRAVDGDIGTIEDFYFEQDHWAIRYLLVDTGTWLSGRRVMLPPMAIQGPWSMFEVPVAMTKEQVRNSPVIDPHRLPSRRGEAEVLRYYGYQVYWREPAAGEAAVDPEAEHLCSTKEVVGYHIQATDGEVGHVDDFLIGERSWTIRYLRVDTSNWLGGKSVIVAPDTLEWIDRSAGRLKVNVTRDSVRQSPEMSSIQSELNIREAGPSWLLL